jgi:hypothetical protein
LLAPLRLRSGATMMISAIGFKCSASVRKPRAW